jgi:hypothetical protein
MSSSIPCIRYPPDGTAFNEAFETVIRDNSLLDFDAMMNLDRGEVVKHAIPQRKTVRLQLSGGSVVYLKRHYPVSIFKIIKNYLKLAPEPTAFDEFANIIAFLRAGLPTVTPIAAGRRRGSFLVTEALEGCMRLDQYLEQTKPAHAAKISLIRRLAGLIQKMHAAGFNHRDLYLCHILRDGQDILYIADLHRVQHRAAVPERWLVKDIAALNYAAPASIISRTDRLRFLNTYLDTQRLSKAGKAFALKVLKKTKKMLEHNKKPVDHCRASMGVNSH